MKKDDLKKQERLIEPDVYAVLWRQGIDLGIPSIVDPASVELFAGIQKSKEFTAEKAHSLFA